MSKTLNVAGPELIRWSVRCVRCGHKDALRWQSAISGHELPAPPAPSDKPVAKGVGPTLFYPVCERHARGLALAHRVTQPRLKLVRIGVYALGGLSVPLLGLVLTQLLMGEALGGPLVWAGLALSLPSAAAGMFCLRSFDRLPLRVLKHTPKALTLRFRSERYADYFKRENEGRVTG